jgi:hypothetical protein
MTMLVSATPPRDHAAHERAIEALAREAHVPLAQVTPLDARECAVLAAGARMTSFLTMLTTRKVREILRHARPAVCTPADVEALADDGAEPAHLCQRYRESSGQLIVMGR